MKYGENSWINAIEAVMPLRADGSRTVRLTHGGHAHLSADVIGDVQPVDGDSLVNEVGGRLCLVRKKV